MGNLNENEHTLGQVEKNMNENLKTETLNENEKNTI
jgi:hypothetical protein